MLKVLSIHGCNKNDLLQLLTDVKLHVDGLVSENVSRTATEIEFIAKVEPSKPTQGEETSLFLHSGIQPAYNTELPQADFLAMAEKLLNLLFTFTASGSRRVLDKIVQLDIDFATLNPIRGFSYWPTPAEFHASDLLLNIETEMIIIAFYTVLLQLGTWSMDRCFMKQVIILFVGEQTRTLTPLCIP